jgi:hypothetical protein
VKATQAAPPSSFKKAIAVTRTAATAAPHAQRPRAVALAARVNGPRVAALALNLGLWTLILLAWRAL